MFWQRGERRAALYMLTGAAAASLRDAVTPIPRLLQSTSVFKMINRRYTVTSFHLLSCCFRPFSTFCISTKQMGYSVLLVMSPFRFYVENWSKLAFNMNDPNLKLSPAPPIIPVWCVIGCKQTIVLHVYGTSDWDDRTISRWVCGNRTCQKWYSPNPNQVVHVPEHNQNINTATWWENVKLF